MSISLAGAHCLEVICDDLGKERNGLTATHLRRYSEIDSDYFDEAVEYGSENGFLDWGRHNRFKLIKPYTAREHLYYEACMQAICQQWRRDNYEDSEFHVENTSSRDTKIVGPWTRPDLTLISHKKFPCTIGEEFDVVTFEVKRPDAANVLAVFEALSHATAATRAYVVFPLSRKRWRKINEEQAQRVEDECSRHGVGLIMVKEPANDPKVDYVIPAAKREIDHQKCSDFLRAVLSDAGKDKISTWK